MTTTREFVSKARAAREHQLSAKVIDSLVSHGLVATRALPGHRPMIRSADIPRALDFLTARSRIDEPQMM